MWLCTSHSDEQFYSSVYVEPFLNKSLYLKNLILEISTAYLTLAQISLFTCSSLNEYLKSQLPLWSKVAQWCRSAVTCAICFYLLELYSTGSNGPSARMATICLMLTSKYTVEVKQCPYIAGMAAAVFHDEASSSLDCTASLLYLLFYEYEKGDYLSQLKKKKAIRNKLCTFRQCLINWLTSDICQLSNTLIYIKDFVCMVYFAFANDECYW